MSMDSLSDLPLVQIVEDYLDGLTSIAILNGLADRLVRMNFREIKFLSISKKLK
jgi:hypothetical protein